MHNDTRLIADNNIEGLGVFAITSNFMDTHSSWISSAAFNGKLINSFCGNYNFTIADNGSYRCFVKSIEKITRESFEMRDVEYYAGNCDNSATFMVNSIRLLLD